MSKILSPADVALIQDWANNQQPKPTIELTNYDPCTGAEGVMLSFGELEVDQAKELLDIREKIKCNVSIVNAKKLDEVTFSKLYPYRSY